jgi:hypothetical protein
VTATFSFWETEITALSTLSQKRELARRLHSQCGCPSWCPSPQKAVISLAA